jgi:CheY-like chemotaxis protein
MACSLLQFAFCENVMTLSYVAATHTVQAPHTAGKVMHTGFGFCRAVRQMHIGLRGGVVNTGAMAATMPEHALANVLIIEDDPQQVWFYSKTLRGYRLTCVPNATAALSEIISKVPDLIILDHVLTGGELGVSFLPQIKALAAHVPIIIISGTLDVQGKLAALQGPRAAHYVIEKPVDLGELEKAVEIALTECGFAEMVSMLESLERAEGPALRNRSINSRPAWLGNTSSCFSSATLEPSQTSPTFPRNTASPAKPSFATFKT